MAVEPPRTHSKLPFRPASPYSTVVRGGSVQSNLPELTANYLSGQLPTSSQCFEGVWCGRTAPKSLKLSCRPASPFVTVVRGGSVGSNRPKLTPTFPVGLFTPSSPCFEEVRCFRTSPNALDPSLYACLPLRHMGKQAYRRVRVRSGRFDHTKPPRTTVLTGEAGLKGRFE